VSQISMIFDTTKNAWPTILLLPRPSLFIATMQEGNCYSELINVMNIIGFQH
jgi:hypothetical protein